MPTNFADRQSYTDQEALDFHAGAKPGKLEIRASKPMATQKDLSLAYSPGVAAPDVPAHRRERLHLTQSCPLAERGLNACAPRLNLL